MTAVATDPNDNRTLSMPLDTPKNKPGRKPLPATELVTDVVDPQIAAEVSKGSTELTLIQEAVTVEQIEFSQWVGERVGRQKTANLLQKLLTVSDLMELREAKESKRYRGLRVASGGKVLTVSTWDEFCDVVVGRSRQHVDEDLANLKAFGSEFLEAIQAFGLGYRQMRDMRAIPMDQRQDLLEAARTGDKDTLIDIAESLIERQAREKQSWDKKDADRMQTLEAKERLLAEERARNDELKEKLYAPWKPSPDSIATTAAQESALKELNEAFLSAHLSALRVATIASAVFDEFPDEPISEHARECVDRLVKELAGLASTHNINVDLTIQEAVAPPAWLSAKAVEAIDLLSKAEAQASNVSDLSSRKTTQR